MKVVEISSDSNHQFSGEVYHADPCDITFRDGDWFAYPGAEKVGKEAVILVPSQNQFLKLRIIMDLLIGPFGCPWDKEQSHESLKKYLLEETYEVIDAIDRQDNVQLREELGDLILQPVFHMNLLANRGVFDFNDALKSINEKLIRRHPHVFGELEVDGSENVLKNWDAIKKKEKVDSASQSILSGVPASMPALARALEISKRAARSGFEWPDFSGVREKVQEELDELSEAIQSGDNDEIESELGDLLFTIVNIGRWQKVDSENALRLMLNRFQKRFEYMEAHADKPLGELSFTEWDELWNLAKTQT